EGLEIEGVEQIDAAGPRHLTFIRTAEYAERWPASKAVAAIVQEGVDLHPGQDRAFIRVESADLAMAIVLDMFAPPPVSPPVGVHERAVVDPAATIGNDVAIGAMCYVGPDACIGDGAVLHPNVTVLEGSRIGAGCVLWPGVVIRERCELGEGCQLHPNVAIGADGYGYRPAADGRSLVKIPQIGTVVIGRDVEIGAGTTVDRGKFSATRIGDGTKIDNLCQVAHNCAIGRCVVMAAMVGLGGSVVVGDGCMIGGGAIIMDHVTLGPGAHLGGHSAVMHDIPAGERWSGMPAQATRATFREYAALRKLPELFAEIKSLREAAGK
ncbi:MAG: UDP-3-O-(3-hydroxymyristoyl)glucosamine N-acyltransferase, partial [Planctomycetota bacterium]